MERYLIAKDSVLEGCLVTPDVYKGILERLEIFVATFIEHLHKRVQRQKAVDYMKGLMADTCRSIEYFDWRLGKKREDGCRCFCFRATMDEVDSGGVLPDDQRSSRTQRLVVGETGDMSRPRHDRRRDRRGRNVDCEQVAR